MKNWSIEALNTAVVLEFVNQIVSCENPVNGCTEFGLAGNAIEPEMVMAEEATMCSMILRPQTAALDPGFRVLPLKTSRAPAHRGSR